MALRCSRCGHLNDPLGSTRFCEVCHHPLPAAPPASAPAAPPAAALPPAPPAAPPVSRPPRPPSPATSAARPLPQPAPPAGRAPVRRPPPPAPARPGELEGAIIRVDALQPEPPDPDPARVLFSLLLVVDLVLLLGSFALACVAALAVFVVAALVLRAGWLMPAAGFALQSVFFFLSPLLGGLLRDRGARPLLPVTNYVVRAGDGAAYTVRVKGQLRGATLQLGDRVRVWGRPQAGILRFAGGEKLDTGEPLLLPVNWSGLLLALLVIANLVGYFVLRGDIRF